MSCGRSRVETIRKTWILFDHEGRVLLRQPLTYWVLALNLFVVNALTLTSQDFFDVNHASILPLSLTLTIFGCFLTPFLTMSAWARATRLDALPWFFSFPIPVRSVVMARFLLTWSFALLALASTFPLCFTLAYLGSPDWGIIIASYIVIALLFAFQVALGSLASAIAPHQLAAFILAAGINLLFMSVGSHLLFEEVPNFLSLEWTDRLAPLGVPFHLVAAFRGVLDFRDLLYFIGWTAFCLFLNQSFIHNRRKQKRPDRTLIFGYAATTLSVLLLVLFARGAHWRWDLTEEKLYTLSAGTKDIVRRLEKPIFADLYFTRNHNEAKVKQFGQRIEELLREYSSTSPQNFRLRLIDPVQDSEEEVRARIAGMQAISTKSGENIYLGLSLRQGDKTVAIPLFNPETEGQLEYELTETMVKLVAAAKPSIGIMSDLPMVGDELGENTLLRNDWAFISALRSLYQPVSIAAQSESIPELLQSLILVHPKNLSDKTLYALDQYLMRGGKLIIFLDAFCRYEINFPKASQGHEDYSSNLKHFLDKWGVVFHTDSLVGDPDRASKVTVAQDSYNYPFEMQLIGDDMNKDMSIAKNLQKINVLESGWFERSASAPKDLQFYPLISSSQTSGIVKTEMTEFLSAQDLSKELKADGQSRIIAALIKGKFPSSFESAPEGAMIEHKRSMDRETAIVLVGDVDFLADNYVVDKLQSMGQMVYKPKADNINFLMNSLEFITGHQDLISIRSKSQIDRTLWRIIDMQQKAAIGMAGADAELSTRLSEIQEKLAMWEAENSEKGQVVSREQLLKIKTLREEEAKIRRERKLLKTQSEAQVRHLKSNILWMHLGFAPLSLIAGLLIMRRFRSIRSA